MPISQRDRDFLISKGIDPDTAEYADESDEKMSGGHAALSTLKAHAGSILGGGGGSLAGGAAGAELGLLGGPAAPFTVPAGAIVGAVAGSLGGSYLGEKGQEAILPEEMTQHLQAEAAQAQEEHPWISRGTEIAASALASGGKPSPGALLRGGKAVLAGDFTSPVIRNLATQAAINPAIDIGTSLAQGHGLPSAKDIGWDVAGGLAFSEPSAFGRLGHRSSGEPTPEPTINPNVTPPIGTGDIGPLRMAPSEPIPSTEPTKNTDLVTQNKMEQTSVTENPIDKKAATEPQVPVEPPVKPLQIPDDVQGKSGLTKAEEDELRHTSFAAPERYAAQTYSPEDLDAYNKLKQRMADEMHTMGTPEFTKLWQDFEDVRNKYGGMPPKVEDTTSINNPNVYGTRNSWIDSYGNLTEVPGHVEGAQDILKNPELDETDAYSQMFKKGYARVVETGDSIYFHGVQTSNKIISELTNRAIESRKKLIEDTGRFGGRKVLYDPNSNINQGPLTESTIRNPVALAQHIQSGAATTGSVLQHLTQTIHHPYSDLAQELLKISDKKSLNVPWSNKLKAGEALRSMYMMGGKNEKVVIAPRNLGDSRVIIEEALHSLTANKLPEQFNKAQGAELFNRMNTYLEQGSNPSIKDLIRAYQKTSQHLGIHDLMFRDVNEAGTEFKGAGGDPDLMHDIGANDAQRNVFYAMGNLHEFLAHAFKNEQFQNLLNEIPSGVEGKSVWQRIVDSVKRLFGMDIKTGSMLDHVLRTSTDIVAQERPATKVTDEFNTNAPKSIDDDYHMGRIGRFTRDVISRVHDIGRPDAKELANATKVSLNEQDRLAGRYRNSIIEAGQKLNSHDMEMINKVRDIENTTGTLSRGMLDSDAQRTYYDTLKRNMSETGDYAIKNNMPVASDKGPRPLKKDPSHWPSMMNDKVSAVYRSGDLSEIAKLDKEFDTWNQTKVGLTPAGSATVIKNWKDAIQGSIRSADVSHQDYFKAFRRAMGTPIPPSFREQNPVKNDARYFDRASIALSHYKYIESNPRVMATLGATHDAWGKPITPNPNGSLANNPQVKDLLNQFKGTPRGLGDSAEQSASSLMSNFLISGPTLESHKLISNAVGAVNLSDNPYQLSRALAHGITNINQGYRHAVENGLAKLSASSTLDMFNGSLSAAQRMNSVGKLIRDVSTIGGLTTKANLGFMQSYFEYLVPSKIQRANAGDINAQRFIKRLDPTYSVGKTYAGPETQQLASVAAGYIHGTGDIRSLPAWMMNDSELSGFFKLAHWSVAQTNNFMKNVWTPASEGNMKPLLTSVFGAAVGGYMIKELREQMQGKKSGIPSLSEIANSDRGLSGNAGPLAYNAIAAMQYSGFGGLLSQVAKYPFDFVYKNIPQGATFPLDQIASDLAKTVGQVTSAIANDPSLNWVDMAKAVTGHLLQNDMQLSRIAINQGINAGLITGLPAEKKLLSDKMGQLRRFDMVEGLPYADIEQTANPYMNIEQQKFKHEPDVQQAVKMIPELVTNIMDRYRNQPDVMMSKLKALKENQYDTMPSLEAMPMQFFRYMQYVQRTQGEEAAQDMMRDYMTRKIGNQVKSTVAP